MKRIDLIRRSTRSLLTAKARTILTAFAIAVGAFALTLTLGASNGAQNYASTIITNNFDPSELLVTNGDTLLGKADTSKPQVYDKSFGSVTYASGAAAQVRQLSDSDLDHLKSLPGIASVKPATSLSLQYITRDGQKQYIATMQAYNSYKNPELLAGAIPGHLKDKTLILPEGFVSALGFKNPHQAIGQTVRLSVKKQVDQSALLAALVQGNTGTATTPTTSREEPFTVIAVSKKPSMVIQPGTELYLYASDQAVARLNDYATQGTASYHKYLTANVKVTDGTNQTKLKAAQQAIKKAGYSAQSVADTEKILTQVINVLEGIVTVFGLIAVVASVFGVVNTMYISVLQRTREIGLMKALGMHKKDITKLFRFEAALIGFLGGLIGCASAIILGTLLNPWITRKLDLGSQHLLDFKIAQAVILIAVLMIVATIAGLLPARKAAHLDPIEALRTE